MTDPVVLTASSPVAVGHQVWITGTNFGSVSSAALVDTVSHEVFDTPDFIVDTGLSLHLTVPRSTPEGLYEVVLGTLSGAHSTNSAGTVNIVLALPGLPPEPVFPAPGTTDELVRQRLRYELGDHTESFSASQPGDGTTNRFELPAETILPTGLEVFTVNTAGDVSVIAPADYTLDSRQGTLTTTDAVPIGTTLYVRGRNAQFFGDDELDMFIASALLKHTHSATARTIVRNAVTGHIKFTTDAVTLTNLPAVEAHPLAILATIEALWVIAADASFDIDVTTAEGTSLPRQERYRAIMQMIEAQQQRYNQLAESLNVGMNRIEMFTLRRVSRTTGRLVPVYQAMEYDEWGPPMRVYPPLDTDISGTGTAHRQLTGQQYPPEQ